MKIYLREMSKCWSIEANHVDMVLLHSLIEITITSFWNWSWRGRWLNTGVRYQRLPSVQYQTRFRRPNESRRFWAYIDLVFAQDFFGVCAAVLLCEHGPLCSSVLNLWIGACLHLWIGACLRLHVALLLLVSTLPFLYNPRPFIL